VNGFIGSGVRLKRPAVVRAEDSPFWNLAHCLIWIGTHNYDAASTASEAEHTGLRLKVSARAIVRAAQKKYGFDLEDCRKQLWAAMIAGDGVSACGTCEEHLVAWSQRGGVQRAIPATEWQFLVLDLDSLCVAFPAGGGYSRVRIPRAQMEDAFPQPAAQVLAPVKTGNPGRPPTLVHIEAELDRCILSGEAEILKLIQQFDGKKSKAGIAKALHGWAKVHCVKAPSAPYIEDELREKISIALNKIRAR